MQISDIHLASSNIKLQFANNLPRYKQLDIQKLSGAMKVRLCTLNTLAALGKSQQTKATSFALL